MYANYRTKVNDIKKRYVLSVEFRIFGMFFKRRFKHFKWYNSNTRYVDPRNVLGQMSVKKLHLRRIKQIVS